MKVSSFLEAYLYKAAGYSAKEKKQMITYRLRSEAYLGRTTWEKSGDHQNALQTCALQLCAQHQAHRQVLTMHAQPSDKRQVPATVSPMPNTFRKFSRSPKNTTENIHTRAVYPWDTIVTDPAGPSVMAFWY